MIQFRLPTFLSDAPSPRLAWVEHLKRDGEVLQRLSADTEGEFLQTGEALQNFYRRAGEISQTASRVAERLCGEEMGLARQELQQVFAEMKQQDQSSRRGVDSLSWLLSAFEEIQGRLDGFDKTVKSLRVLCNFIRIESARLGERNGGFDALSNDVRNLSVTVAAKTADLASRSAAIAGLIRKHLEMAAEFSSRQQERGQVILERAEQNLSALTSRYQQSSVTLQGLAGRWVHVSKSIGEIVSSLQFHDITRQRLEHAGEALAVLGREATATVRPAGLFGSGFPWKGHRGQKAQEAAALFAPCEIQVAQLRHAQADLTEAMVGMNRHLREIAADAVGMSREIGRLAGHGGGENRSFLLDLEREMTALLASLSDYVKINGQYDTSLASVQSTVGDMSSFIKEIEVIGIQMRMIALNACVHAARIGCDGEVLGVLAESIHQLSVDTAGQIASISGSLKAIVDETGSLSCGTLNSGEAGLLRREGDTGHVHEVLAPLHRMDEEISALLSRIDREGSSLSEDIERAIGENRAQERMERGISEVVSGLTKMIDEMKALVPAADREQKKQALAGLAERYTMEQERQIHRSVAASLPLAAASSLVAEGGAEQGAELGGQEVPASGGEEFGDNVELF